MKLKIFFKSALITAVFLFNSFLLIFGICKVYENVRLIAYGEYVSAVELTENGIRILDYNLFF